MNISEHETQRLVAAEKDGLKISVIITDQTKAEIRESELIEGGVHKGLKTGIEELVDYAARKVFHMPPDEKPKLGKFIVNKKEVHACVCLHVYVAKED